LLKTKRLVQNNFSLHIKFIMLNFLTLQGNLGQKELPINNQQNFVEPPLQERALNGEDILDF
jgi:hypothetical protein